MNNSGDRILDRILEDSIGPIHVVSDPSAFVAAIFRRLEICTSEQSRDTLGYGSAVGSGNERQGFGYGYGNGYGNGRGGGREWREEPFI